MELDDLKIPEFARGAKLPEITVRRWVLTRRLEARKDALGRWRIPASELERFLKGAA